MSRQGIRALLLGLLISGAMWLVLLGLAALLLHFTGHLSWFWTGDPNDIIGGNGLQIGDLHLFLH